MNMAILNFFDHTLWSFPHQHDKDFFSKKEMSSPKNDFGKKYLLVTGCPGGFIKHNCD